MNRTYAMISRNTHKLRMIARQLSSHNATGDTYEAVQTQCKRFAEEKLKPYATMIDHEGSFPKKQIEELATLGLMAITAPSKYGGSGMDMTSLSVAVEELSRGCASTGAIVSIHNILYIDFLSTHGTEEQKEHFLVPYTRGIPGAFALSEPDAGSDVANISTSAKRSGNGFILNGRKSWVTSGRQADTAIIFGNVGKNKNRNDITAFLVPLNAKGLHIYDSGEKMGIRGTSTCEIELCDVLVPEENVLGGIGNGFKLALKQLCKARIGIASQAVGIAQASLDTALEYATCRRAFDCVLSDFQAVQLRLARMAAQIEAARLLVRRSAELCDSNEDIIKISAITKLLASEAATFASHQCIQILGGMGYVKSMPAERYYRDARITEIYGGVSDIQMLVIAEQLLKQNGKRLS